MARPTVLKFNGGEITFRNIPKEQIDMLKDVINKVAARGPVITEKQALELLNTPSNLPPATKLDMVDDLASHYPAEYDKSNDLTDYNLPMDQKAVGFSKNVSGSYILALLNYNLENKQAMVTELKDLGKSRIIAENDLRVYVGKNFL